MPVQRPVSPRGLGLPQSGGSPTEQQRAGAIRQHLTDVVLQRQTQLGRKLTDAEVKVLDGYSRMLRQSGIKIDTKEGINFYHPFFPWGSPAERNAKP